MRNLEIKAPVADPAALRARVAAIGAGRRGEFRQVDTFYRVERGFLKLRVIDGGAGELIAYERPLVAGSRMSDYRLARVEEPAALAAVLDRALTRLVEVRKSRELWMYGGTRIHLDTVEGLGAFVELETEGNSRSDDAMRAEHDEVIETLGLDRATFLPGTYAAMLAPPGVRVE